MARQTYTSDAHVPTAHIEDALDRVAGFIEAQGVAGVIYLPIYQRLESALIERQQALASVRDRVRRSKHRTAERYV